MNGRAGGLLRDADGLARWVRVAAWIASIGGALLLGMALRIAWVLAGERPPRIFFATVLATLAVTALCLGFLLRRYGQKLSVTMSSGQLWPLADGAAYETGYWRVVAPFIVLATVTVTFLSPATLRRIFAESEWAREAGESAPFTTLVLYAASLTFLGLAVLVVARAITRRTGLATSAWRAGVAHVQGTVEGAGRAIREARARHDAAPAPVAPPRAPATPTGDLPQALIEQWSRTRPLVSFAGCLGTFASLMLAVAAVVVGMFFFDFAPLFAAMCAVFFCAMLGSAASGHLRRQAAAIKEAERERSISAAEDVLDRQTRYWKLIGVFTISVTALALAAIIVGALIA